MRALSLRIAFLAVVAMLAACSGGTGPGAGDSSVPQSGAQGAGATRGGSSAMDATRGAAAATTGGGATIVQTAIAAPDSTVSTSVTVTLPQAPAPGDVLAFGVWSSAGNPTIVGPTGVAFGGAHSFGAGNGQPSIWFRDVQSGDGRTWTFTSNVPSAIVVGAVEAKGGVTSGTPGVGTWSAITNSETGWAQATFPAPGAGDRPIAFFFSSTGGISWTLSPTAFTSAVYDDQSVSTESHLSAQILHSNLTTIAGNGSWWGGATASAPATGAEMSLYIYPGPAPTPTPTPTPSPVPTVAPVVDSTATPIYLDEYPSIVYGDTTLFGKIRGAASDAPVDGVGCGAHEATATHYHVHVTLYDNQHQYAMPAGTGIYEPSVLYPPYFMYNTASLPASCFYGIHVHALMGMVHVEMPGANAFGTLGEFFDIAGLPLTSGGVGPLTGATRWFDTDETTGAPGSHPVTEMSGTDPHLVKLIDHHEYTVEIGPQWVPIPNYTFSPNFK
jgi:hypothetical protein